MKKNEKHSHPVSASLDGGYRSRRVAKERRASKEHRPHPGGRSHGPPVLPCFLRRFSFSFILQSLEDLSQSRATDAEMPGQFSPRLSLTRVEQGLVVS